EKCEPCGARARQHQRRGQNRAAQRAEKYCYRASCRYCVPNEERHTDRRHVRDEVPISERTTRCAAQREVIAIESVSLRERAGGAKDRRQYYHRHERTLEAACRQRSRAPEHGESGD